MTKLGFLILCVALLASSPSADAGGTVADEWSPLIVWRDQNDDPANAEHITLLPDGQLVLFGYQTGEFSMVRAAAERGWIDGEAVAREMLVSMRRAGADVILTYFAAEVAAAL